MEGTQYGILLAMAEAEGLGVTSYMHTNQPGVSALAMTNEGSTTSDFDSHSKSGWFVNLSWNYIIYLHTETGTTNRWGEVWLKLTY